MNVGPCNIPASRDVGEHTLLQERPTLSEGQFIGTTDHKASRAVIAGQSAVGLTIVEIAPAQIVEPLGPGKVDTKDNPWANRFSALNSIAW
jgi:hypothetical protein